MIYGTQQPSLTTKSPTFTPLSLPPSAFQYPSEGLSSSKASLTSSPYSTPASSLFPSLAFASLPSFTPVTSLSDHHPGNHTRPCRLCCYEGLWFRLQGVLHAIQHKPLRYSRDQAATLWKPLACLYSSSFMPPQSPTLEIFPQQLFLTPCTILCPGHPLHL